MNSWREPILNDFVPNVSKLTLVADPDSLLTEEKLALALRERGFDLIEFNDPVEFRYAYESRYRAIWDRGEHTDLVVVLRLQNGELDALPYDLLQAGRKLSFNLGDLFPNFSYPVIEKLDGSVLDALFEAQKKSPPDRMGDNATKDFILRYVFRIAAELISNEVDLLRALLRLHYSKTRIPHILAERLVQVLRGSQRFSQWPLDEIVPDDEAFFAFLQERWPVFLRGFGEADSSSTAPTTRDRVKENFPGYDLKYPGPYNLPFDHQDIKVYIDNLFVEGKLAPVEVPPVASEGAGAAHFATESIAWIRSGILHASSDDAQVRISRLFGLVERELPTGESRYLDWISFALKWAELSALVHCESDGSHKSQWRILGDSVNASFTEWLNGHYASLVNLPPTNPAMLHQVPRRLARNVEESTEGRVALIVVDGLALDQWVTVRQLLLKQDSNLMVREDATFAWIPTLTSVSRQALFSGNPPLYFPSSVYSTNSEEKLWKKFWEGQNVSRLDVAYQRGLGDPPSEQKSNVTTGDIETLLEATVHPGRTKVIGLVVDKVDKIMHGMQLGSAGMHNQIKQWSEGGFLSALIGYLLDHGYEVWLTADHGNIEGEGKGRPAEGVIAETRGQRARVYPTPELRSEVVSTFTFAHEWQPVGLPPEFFPLVVSGRDAFATKGELIVGHGGVAIEEVIVPLVKFERKPR